MKAAAEAEARAARAAEEVVEPWPPAELSLLLKAAKKFQPGCRHRWETIAGFVNQHCPPCHEMFEWHASFRSQPFFYDGSVWVLNRLTILFRRCSVQPPREEGPRSPEDCAKMVEARDPASPRICFLLDPHTQLPNPSDGQVRHFNWGLRHGPGGCQNLRASRRKTFSTVVFHCRGGRFTAQSGDFGPGRPPPSPASKRPPSSPPRRSSRPPRPR